MYYRIIGDIHGCFHTFKRLLETFREENEILIQVGDLIDRGRFIPQTVALARELQSTHPDTVVFLRGNHEDDLIALADSGYTKPSLVPMWSDTLTQYQRSERNFEEDLHWLRSLALYYEDRFVFVSHAGISIRKPNLMASNQFLWHRDPLRNIGKIQVYGHTPLFDSKISHDRGSDSYNIDSACVYGGQLSALVLDEAGRFVRIDQAETDQRDQVGW